MRSDGDMAHIRKHISNDEMRNRLDFFFKSRSDMEGIQNLLLASTTTQQRHEFNQEEVVNYFKSVKTEKDPKKQRKANNMLTKLLT